ncbi:MAG: hypothetical protein IJ801_08010 [Lachnospiraceae bacterium]|nr:hypothetical protein [Lachnospiraceae bacterium]
MKDRIILSMIILLGTVFGVCIYAYAANSTANSVVVKNHQIVKGEDIWNNFKKNTSDGRSDSIHIIMDEDGKLYNNELSFDGAYFQYHSEMESKMYKRKYLLDLKGEVPVAKTVTRWVVLADQKYTLNELINSVTSNDSGDWLDFDIIFLD